MFACAPEQTGRPLWRVSLFDWVTWVVTYVVTAFVGVTIGLAVGVALTCLLAVVQTQRARGRRLTRAADTEIYYHHWRPTTTATTTSCATIPAGVVVYRSVHEGMSCSCPGF